MKSPTVKLLAINCYIYPLFNVRRCSHTWKNRNNTRHTSLFINQQPEHINHQTLWNRLILYYIIDRICYVCYATNAYYLYVLCYLHISSCERSTYCRVWMTLSLDWLRISCKFKKIMSWVSYWLEPGKNQQKLHEAYYIQPTEAHGFDFQTT